MQQSGVYFQGETRRGGSVIAKPSLEQLLRALLLADNDKRNLAYRVLQGRMPQPSIRPAAPLLMSMSAASKYLGVSRSTMFRLLQEGRIRRVELSPGFALIRRADIEQIAAEGTHGNQSDQPLTPNRPRRKPDESFHHHPNAGS